MKIQQLSPNRGVGQRSPLDPYEEYWRSGFWLRFQCWGVSHSFVEAALRRHVTG